MTSEERVQRIMAAYPTIMRVKAREQFAVFEAAILEELKSAVREAAQAERDGCVADVLREAARHGNETTRRFCGSLANQLRWREVI
jgi:hypothetical protein